MCTTTVNSSFKDAIGKRRSFYAISNGSPVPDREIEEILEFVLNHVPTPYNSQSPRLVLLLGKEHRKFWDIVRETLRKITSEDRFPATENKINKAFASGYGTVLFFEDNETVEKLQKKFPSYKDTFPVWSQHTSAMHQFAVWTMLEDIGFGASLQHYNPLIDNEVRATWDLPESWQLVAQIPFGMPMEVPEKKDKMPVEQRMKVFK